MRELRDQEGGLLPDAGGLTFSLPELRELLGCPVRESTCCTQDCQNCPAGGNGASVGGEGAAFCPQAPGTGRGAALAYAAGGAGAPGTPGAADWRPVLGRGWSHDYAERIVPEPDESHVWLLTRFATFTEFSDLDAGVYRTVSPSDEYRTLAKTATGWELRGLDGTVTAFDTSGRWAGTTDADGNAKTPTYDAAGDLAEVAFPDGRRERFTYHIDGKLAAIEEVGVDGTTSRVWSYAWNGDDLERIDRPDGTALAFFYDDGRFPGHLTRAQEIAAGGGTSRGVGGWEYDEAGNVVATWRGDSDPGPTGDRPGPGAVDVWRLAFDDPEAPTQTLVTDPLGAVATYVVGRDPEGTKPRVISISGDCPACGLGPNSQLLYDDPNHPLRPSRVVDGRGTATLLTYTDHGQVASRTEAFGTPLERTTTFEYADPGFPGQPTAVEQPSTSGAGLRRTATTYDAGGNTVTRTLSGVEAGSAVSFTTTTVYNAAGQPTAIDPPGYGAADRTTFTYDPARGDLLPLSRTDPLVGTTTFAYDPFNRTTSVTDPNGVTTETVYDELDRVRFVIRRGATTAEDLTTEHLYDGFGDLFQTLLPESNVLEYGYDPAGRLTSIERKPDPTTPGERTLYDLDPAGNRIREELQRWDGAGFTTDAATDFVYSTRCQLETILYPDGTATEYDYDCDGNLERLWDANHPSAGQTAQPTQLYAYDPLDRLVSITQPWDGTGGGDAVTRYQYDVQDHLTRVTDAEGNVTSYVYSDRDLLTRQDSEVSGVTTYAYTEHGELASQTDARPVTVTRTVDAADRVVFVDYPDNSLDTSYTYDDPAVPFSNGRLTAITRNGASVDYRYDRFGRVTQDGGLTYAYDGNGNRTSIGYPGGVVATSTYDFADRQETLTLQDGGGPAQPVVTAASYLSAGPLASLTLGNGLVETRTFDERYFPTGIDVPGRLDWDYTTDAVGNILSIADGGGGPSRTYAYQDVHYFLTRGDGPWGDLSWTYDKIGNRLTETRDGEVSTYAYPANAAGGRNPKLSEVSQPATGERARYFHDAAGNQTHKAVGRGKQRFGYDAEGRLAQIRAEDEASPAMLVQFRYDGRSYLDSATRTPLTGTATAPVTTTATYSSEGLLHQKVTTEPFDASTPRGGPARETTSSILYFAGRPVGRYDRIEETDAQGQVTVTTGLTFLTTDHLGTPVLATDSGGAETWAGGFEPFGADFSGAQEAGQFLRFPGQWQDAAWDGDGLDSGLYQNVHRWYETGTGRYSRTDPLRSMLGPSDFSFTANGMSSTYAYVGGRLLNWVDPLGLEATNNDRLNCLLNPIECRQVNECRRQAFQAERDRFGTGGHKDAADAYRHCYWSCCMAKAIGSSRAEKWGDGHENWAGNPACELEMDQFNNQQGRGTGPNGPSTSCESHCTNVPLQPTPGPNCCPGQQYPSSRNPGPPAETPRIVP